MVFCVYDSLVATWGPTGILRTLDTLPKGIPRPYQLSPTTNKSSLVWRGDCHGKTRPGHPILLPKLEKYTGILRTLDTLQRGIPPPHQLSPKTNINKSSLVWRGDCHGKTRPGHPILLPKVEKYPCLVKISPLKQHQITWCWPSSNSTVSLETAWGDRA